MPDQARAAMTPSVDDAVLRVLARHGTPTRHHTDGEPPLVCHCWNEAKRLLTALRALPVEQRMEAMGMERGTWDLAGNGDPFVFYVVAETGPSETRPTEDLSSGSNGPHSTAGSV